jgi:hypothetical protein
LLSRFTDELTEKSKIKQGKFAQLSRFPPQERAATAPGPGSYNPSIDHEVRASTASVPPFGRAAKRFTPLLSRMVDVNAQVNVDGWISFFSTRRPEISKLTSLPRCLPIIRSCRR